MSQTETATVPVLRLSSSSSAIKALFSGLQSSPLPPARTRDPDIAHAPYRTHGLSEDEKRLAVANALRYFPASTHSILAEEFAAELRDFGHIYMYRFMPEEPLHAIPIDKIPAR